MNSLDIIFNHEESSGNLALLIEEINGFCLKNSFIACGLVDTFSNGNITIISNNESTTETQNNEIKNIFQKYKTNIKKFAPSTNTNVPTFPKIILYNDNI